MLIALVMGCAGITSTHDHDEIEAVENADANFVAMHPALHRFGRHKWRQP